MLTFWIICGLMVVFVFWFVLPPLLQGQSATKPDEVRDANLLVYQDQHRELDADLKSGLLTDEQYQKDKEELERRLLEEVSAGDDSRAVVRPMASRRLVYVIAITIPVAAVLFYFAVGNPKALEVRPPNSPASSPR